MAGQKTINTVTPAIGAIKIQQSTYGLVLPIVWGMTRITGNLIWYGEFKATPHTTVTQSGGKGGGAPSQSTTTYTYTASVAMLLCEGPIVAIPSAWRGKKIYGAAAYSGAAQLATALFQYDGSPITVSNTVDWSDVSVERVLARDEQADYKYYRGGESEPLLRGVDYTAVGGVYTFINGSVGNGETIRIRYLHASLVAGASSLGSLGMDLFRGTPGQAPWPYLTSNHPSEALGYSSIAYLAAANYALDDGASVENHSFEVESAFRFSSTIPDASPAVIVVDAMSNPQYGAGFGAEKLSTTDYAAACAAQGIFLSPALTEQTSAADFLAAMAGLTNVGLVWSGGVLKFVPYTDMAISGNGVTFTPNTAPIYDLTDDDFQSGDEEGPVKVLRGSVRDTFNSVTLEFLDRANGYNIGIMPAQDQADIQENGLRSMPTIKAHWITQASVAKIVATLILQRSLFVRNTYQFKLGWTKIGLEPMDLVTLTDPVLMNKQPVRILTIEEDDSGYLDIVAEDFPKGSASATLYPSTSGAGFAHDYNESPGTLGAPVIFEAPAALVTQEGGLEIWLAAGSSGPTYGGCEVWVSLSGANFERAAVLHGASRFGVTTSALAATTGATTETVGVSLAAGGQILTGTAADMNALATLCYVGGEFIAYETATLTGGSAYSLGNHMLRGAYLSVPAVHASGAEFVRCDEAIARMPLSPDYIGKQLHIKLLPFNRYGGGTGDLASAVEYTYTVTGAQANNPPVAPAGLALEGAFTISTAKFKWDRVSNAAAYNVQVYNGLTKVREVNVGDALRFDYSYADAKVDGGPFRDLTVKVQGIHANGAPGGFSTLAVSNPQIGGLTGISARAGMKNVQFACDRPADPDFHGVLVCLSAVSGFTPGDETLVYDGPNTALTLDALRGGSTSTATGLVFRNTRSGAALVHGDTHFLATTAAGQALVNGVTYYLRAAAYDTFDRLGLTWSDEFSVTPAAAVIPDGSITASQLADALSSRINLIDAAGTGLIDKVAALNTTYGSTAAAATSAANAAQAEADAVAAKVAAVLAAGAAGDAATDANGAKVAAQAANAAAGSSAGAAATSASSASGFADAAGGAAAAANSLKLAAESANTAAGTSAGAAATSASSAAGYADAAGGAAAASNSAKLAAESANTAAGTSAGAAATSASTAAGYADAAGGAAAASNSARLAAESASGTAAGAASAAATSRDTATTKAGDAATSAASAMTSANTAATKAAEASTSASSAATSETNAAGSASSASTSANNAATSAGAAGGSASAAAGSASGASTSADAASNSASAANSAKVSAESARDAAAGSASAASTSASTASTKASEAAVSASSATTSANTATTKAGEALTYRDSAASSASDAAGHAAAAASDYSAVIARLNNAGGTGVTVEQSMSAQADSITGLSGQLTFKIDNNSHVTGFGLASTPVNGVPQSAFTILADAFQVVGPAGPVPMFSIGGGTVGFSGELKGPHGAFGAVEILESLRCGQTAYNTGTGIWQGLDGGVPKMSCGTAGGPGFLWDGTNFVVNGARISAPVLDNFSVAAIADINSSGSNGTRIYGSRTAVPSGGQAPYQYNWSLELVDVLPPSTVTITGNTTPTVTVKGTASNDATGVNVTCAVTDHNGRTIYVTFAANGTHF